MRSANAGGVSPPGSRVQCARRNDSGTSAPVSFVSSTHTGTMNGLLRAIMCVRWSARFHSRRKYPSWRAAVLAETIGMNNSQSRICWRIFWSHASPPRSSLWSNHGSMPAALSASQRRWAACASCEA